MTASPIYAAWLIAIAAIAALAYAHDWRSRFTDAIRRRIADAELAEWNRLRLRAQLTLHNKTKKTLRVFGESRPEAYCLPPGLAAQVSGFRFDDGVMELAIRTDASGAFVVAHGLATHIAVSVAGKKLPGMLGPSALYDALEEMRPLTPALVHEIRHQVGRETVAALRKAYLHEFAWDNAPRDRAAYLDALLDGWNDGKNPTATSTGEPQPTHMNKIILGNETGATLHLFTEPIPVEFLIPAGHTAEIRGFNTIADLVQIDVGDGIDVSVWTTEGVSVFVNGN